jgi:hypothetical protein
MKTHGNRARSVSLNWQVACDICEISSSADRKILREIMNKAGKNGSRVEQVLQRTGAFEKAFAYRPALVFLLMHYSRFRDGEEKRARLKNALKAESPTIAAEVQDFLTRERQDRRENHT